jgi:integrase
MTQASLSKRRGQGEDSIYWDASKNRFVGAVSLGFSSSGTRIRKKVVGRTKTEVRDKLRELHQQVESGLRPRRRYTVGDALDDWLSVGVDGLSARTVSLYQDTIAKALREELGSARLTELTAGDVQGALGVLASRLSTRTVQIAHNVLVRAIRQAERDDLVSRNVAALVKPPKGQLGGRPSKSLTLEQAVSLMAAARGTRLEAYVTLSLLTGLRTEEVRALRWDHVVAWVQGQWEPVGDAGFDHEQLAVFVWRADRAGGDTKTPKSRRTLALPRRCVEALREHRVRQAEDRLAAGPLWQDHGLVFASTVGTPQDDHNVRRQFRVITEAAGLGNTWVPRELRHTFVSLLSAHGVPGGGDRVSLGDRPPGHVLHVGPDRKLLEPAPGDRPPCRVLALPEIHASPRRFWFEILTGTRRQFYLSCVTRHHVRHGSRGRHDRATAGRARALCPRAA